MSTTTSVRSAAEILTSRTMSANRRSGVVGFEVSVMALASAGWNRARLVNDLFSTVLAQAGFDGDNEADAAFPHGKGP
jgi:hypothetical protein